MTNVRIENVLKAFERSIPPSTTDYSIIAVDNHLSERAYFARTREGMPALLIPIAQVASETNQFTQGLAFRAVPSLEFVAAHRHWYASSSVIECRDDRLLKTFAAMTIAIIGRIESDGLPTWEFINSLFSEWEQLLRHKSILSREGEIGLWGELWCILRTTRPSVLLEAWRGPDSGPIDFLLDGKGFEVKASRRCGVHQVSQSQVGDSMGEALITFVSIFVTSDPMRGITLPEIVERVSNVVTDFGLLQEKLAAVGYRHDDSSSYSHKLALAEPPLFFASSAIPRVRSADPGVSQIRYRVELAKDASLSGPQLAAAATFLGLNLANMEYPCV